jgi:hypothetical protein
MGQCSLIEGSSRRCEAVWRVDDPRRAGSSEGLDQKSAILGWFLDTAGLRMGDPGMVFCSGLFIPPLPALSRSI